jgi:peptidyl-prolyl cis-trans isomerase C
MMTRDYLKLEAATALGVAQDPKFLRRMESKEKEMRVTYFYYADVLGPASLTPEEVERFFEENRQKYRAPVSYKVASFTGTDRTLMERLAADWKGGASFGDLRARYEAEDPALETTGETGWLYEGEDLTRDNLVLPLEEGGVSDLRVGAEKITVYRLVTKRSSRLLAFDEIRDQVAQHARDEVANRRLEAILDQERKQIGVRVFEKAVAKMKVDDLAALAAAPAAAE